MIKFCVAITDYVAGPFDTYEEAVKWAEEIGMDGEESICRLVTPAFWEHR